MLVVVLLAAVAAVVFWTESEPIEPSPAASPMGAEESDDPSPALEGGSAPRDVPSMDANRKEQPAPLVAELAPAATEKPERRTVNDSDITWTEERYADAQAEREAIREGAQQERRKLNVEERVEYWAVESRLIDEIGPDAYDEFLYDNGRMNRSKVHWVAPNSHAGQAGIESGDILVSYAGKPAFGPFSVRETNRLFPPGEQIVVQVERAGQILEFTLSSDTRNRQRSGIVNGMTLLPFAMEP